MTRTCIALATLLFAGCWGSASSSTQTAPANTAPPMKGGVVPTVELVSEQEWETCQEEGRELAPGFYCDGQILEGGVPLRYAQFPAVSTDGSVIAVVEERDGWGHVKPGVRLLDRGGRTVQWFSLEGERAVAKGAVERTNKELATRTWVPLRTPAVSSKELTPDVLAETALAFGDYTAVYKRRNDGNVWLPPSEIRVTDARGQVIAERTDTERAWAAENACNMPAFELVGASAKPGVILFKTGLGMGGHNCDGVLQPPHWHVFTF
ncbi:MAG: hypothetical protein SFX73_40640 [Kofleriaceae bacterium]|nr:hypothetical protein [Kofleriaceae bacterium]